MRVLPVFHAFSVSLGLALPVQAADPALHIRLDQATPLQNDCQMVFVLENRMGTGIDSLQAETVLLSAENRVLRLSLLDFQSLPENGLRVRSFNFAGLACDQIGRVLFNAVGPCAPQGAAECAAALQVGSETAIEVVK
ncbi:hypothetical protein [Roseinatronobacter alkalisoli]|uniref:Tat pathway signal sequence domain protein n=1 Tax=Roseinatronobacter alkalisoli TaxID=3028235 RepID=A0ABT5T3Y9_9RHOB|nr:hypothetical protein [Roseinatronobacter sp. HJB301]MDD7969838.1 hypothetical protein [Roseinatronobacter sp. HJB301]